MGSLHLSEKLSVEVGFMSTEIPMPSESGSMEKAKLTPLSNLPWYLSEYRVVAA